MSTKRRKPLGKPVNQGAKASDSEATAEVAKPAESKTTNKRRHLSFRVSAANWRRVRQFALDRESTVQDVIFDALNELFAKKGLPPLEPEEDGRK